MRIKILKYYFGLSILFLFAGISAVAQTTQQKIQTAYLEKIFNYIEWPTNNMSDDIFKIAVIGNLDLCELIKSTFSSRTIKNMKGEVICSQNIENLHDIDVLFLSSSKIKELEFALKLCSNQAFLLITESKSFAKRGSHINFYITDEQTLHFEMNKTNLDKDNFKVDFLLLDFAKVIKQ